MGGNHPRKGVDAPRRLEQNREAVSNRGRDRRRRARVTADQLEEDIADKVHISRGRPLALPASRLVKSRISPV